MSEIIDQTEEADGETISLVDEALVAGNIANTNGLLVILAKLVAKGLADNGGFTEAEMRMIDRENALTLMPRLKV